MTTFRPGPTPLTGKTEKTIMALVRNGRFVGSVANLAELSGCREDWVWRAIASLAARGYIFANGTGNGNVDISRRRR